MKDYGKCIRCGTALSKSSKKYCSLECQKNYEKEERFSNIDKSDSYSGYGLKVVKKYLRERIGNCCSICGIKEWLGLPVPLVMDHIDGNSDNWLKTNLRLVCGNCDMQLPTYKSKNIGKGRAYRRDRYAAGKSY